MQLGKDFIPLFRPSCTDAEIRAVESVLRSGWWGQGKIAEEFESEFAKFVGMKHAVAVNSCTSALHLALRMLKRSTKGKPNIVVPALTFASTAAVGLYEGYEVRFADIDEKTLCADPNNVKRQMNENTIAYIPVHYAGVRADVDNLRYDVPMIEDCAHYGVVRNAHLNTHLMACYSFHAVKNVAAGDMGVIVTDREIWTKKLRELRWMGISSSTYDREKQGYNWEYEIGELGYKYNPNDILAALALAQLRRIDELNGRRQIIAAKYNELLAGLPVRLPYPSATWHLYVVRVNADKRNKFVDFMRENKISVGVHYKPLYKYKVFNWSGELPVTEKAWREIVSLPMYPDMDEDTQLYIVDCIERFFK